MNSILYKIKTFFKPLFFVDKRALGFYRVLLGVLCFIDLTRRWHFIDIFYTNNSIISISTSNSYYKNFTLLSTFTTSWEVHLFFAIAIFASIMFIVGYKTKFFQIICTVFLISIHNRAIMLENAGDFVVNSLLVLSLFLPLGISFSFDSLKKSLKINESNVSDLNNFTNLNEKKEIFSIAYFGILIQLASIYFFTGLNKSGYDWGNGSAVFKMFQLDTFLTPTGYHLREYVDHTVSKIFTYSTLGLEFSAPILLLLPFYSHILRFIFIVFFTAFHLGIRISIKVGLFSYTMISTFVLLLDKNSIDKISKIIKNKFYCNDYILFYDTDCGFCHFTARIIKRLDIFNNIEFAGQNYNGDKPDKINKMIDYTVVLYNKKNKKYWIKQTAFGKILNTIPLGFIFSWIFFLPLVDKILEYIYDCVALNRTKVSKFFGFAACDIKENENIVPENNLVENDNAKFFKNIGHIINSMCVSIIILASLNYNLVANKSVNEYMEEYNYDKFKHNKILRKISSYPRMIQRWNMFSPTVLGTDKTVVVEVILNDGTTINPFTGEPAILNSLDYPNLWHDHNQFWRKFFSRVTKKQNSKYISKFEKWIKKNGNDYFAENLNGKKIKSVKLWSLSQRNRNINSTKENKVIKRLLNKSTETNKNNKKPTKKL